MPQQPTLIHLISSNRWGGARQYALDICSHYHKEGWTVKAMTRDAKVVDDRFKAAGIELFHGPLRGVFDPASVLMLMKHLKAIPLNKGYVHVHKYRDAFTVLLAKRLTGRKDIRVISTRHKVRRGRNSWLFRRIYDKINAHIFVSKTAYEHFRRTWSGKMPIKPERVHILHNSVNIPPSMPVHEPDKGPIFALYLGPVVKGKGIETIIDAMASLKGMKVRLRIAGRGNPDDLDRLRRRAMARNVMEMIDWRTTGNESEELIAQSHFAVLPSVEREGFGLSNLRVMAAGRPQICTHSGAQTEYLSDGETALFVPPADAFALADAMKKLAANPDLRADMGTKAYQQYVSALSWQSFVPKLTEIYLNS